MRYRRLGSTGLEVSVIGLGTWQLSGEWGKHFTRPEVDRLVGRAGELGVTLIDTAECYGDHLAESLVGAAIAADRERWLVATKFGHRFHAERMRAPGWDPVALRTDHWSPREVVGQLEDSLRALGTDYIDIYQSHGGSDAEFETAGLWEALQEQVRAGKIRHLGISLDPDDGARAERAPELDASVIQVTYNRLNRVAEERVLPAAARLDLGLLAREPLANGYLSGKYRPGGRITSPGDWRSSRDPREVEAKLETVAQIEATEVPAAGVVAKQRPDPDVAIVLLQRVRRHRRGRQPPGGALSPPGRRAYDAVVLEAGRALKLRTAAAVSLPKEPSMDCRTGPRRAAPAGAVARRGPGGRAGAAASRSRAAASDPARPGRPGSPAAARAPVR